MAQSRGSSNTVDWRDVVGNMVAFEAVNHVRIEVRLTTADYRGRADLAAQVMAWSVELVDGVPSLLASVNATCSATRLKTLEGLVIHGLYLLDGKLAEREFAEVPAAVDRFAAQK